jgi:hypothetical protein
MMVGFIATLFTEKSGGGHQLADRQNRTRFVGSHKFMKIIGLDFIQIVLDSPEFLQSAGQSVFSASRTHMLGHNFSDGIFNLAVGMSG